MIDGLNHYEKRMIFIFSISSKEKEQNTDILYDQSVPDTRCKSQYKYGILNFDQLDPVVDPSDLAFSVFPLQISRDIQWVSASLTFVEFHLEIKFRIVHDVRLDMVQLNHIFAS